MADQQVTIKTVYKHKQLTIKDVIAELERIVDTGTIGSGQQNTEAQIAVKLIRRIKTEGILFL